MFHSCHTRAHPGHYQSFQSISKRRENASGHESFPVLSSDVPFFDKDTGNRFSLAIIKPEVNRLMYKVECVMAQNGFIVIKKEVMKLTRDQAELFYIDLVQESYFDRLVKNMTKGPVVVYVLYKINCVENWNRLLGPKDVIRAKRLFPTSLRAIYGTEKGRDPVANGFHGSVSPAAARREIKFFFPNMKLDGTTDVKDDLVEYIQDAMMPKISEGLSKMLKIHPNDPLRWFGNWLLAGD